MGPREWLQRFLGTLTRRRHDTDLEQELRSHLEQAADAARRSTGGDAALRAARIAGGGTMQAMDALRDQRGLPWLEDLARDVQHGLRALRKMPVFAAVAILTLALGIGANTAIFSIVSGVLLRPLAYPNPAQLMYFTSDWQSLSVAEYFEFQQFNRSCANVGAFRTGESNLSAGDRALRVRSALVDAHLLKALGLSPFQGRLFTDADSVVTAPALPGESAAAMPVVLISYEIWQSVFGAGPIVGRTIDVDGRPLEVVGVMARGADLMDNHTDLWLPLGFSDAERRARNNHNLTLIGRLKDGITPAAAQTELNALIDSWSARAGITPGGGHEGHVFLPRSKGRNVRHILQMTPLADQILGRAGRSIWVLQGAVGLLLLIACANVANLLMARAETREREFAVLAALGAGRNRLVRKTLTESVILSVAGAALGLLLARAGVDALIRVYPASLPRIAEAAVDQRVMLISITLAVACGLLFGLAPAMHARADNTAETLKSGGGRGSIGTTRHRLRRGLVIAETALAVIVVVGAGLLLRTVHNLTAVDTGFDRSRLVTFSITLPRATFDNMARVRAYQRLVEQLRAVPGIAMSTAMTGLPLDRPARSNQTEIAHSPVPIAPIAPLDYQRVMSGFFETTGIQIVRGRAFDSGDAASSGAVAIVNETLARTYWPDRDPIGQQLRPGGTTPWFTVIGVARDVKQTGVDQDVRAEAYALLDQTVAEVATSFLSFSPTTMNIVARTSLPLATLTPAIARVVHDVDPTVPIARLREMDDVFNESIRRPRLVADLLTMFSVVALLLAAIGTYGVLASMVAARRRETGIRLALGAARMRVLGEVMKQGLLPTSAGLAIGASAALALGRFMSSLLFGVQPTDPTTLVTVIVTLAVVAALACGLPAWRASRLDPSAVLRAE